MGLPRYFMFSPIEMSIDEAFEVAYEYLEPDQIIHVQPDNVEVYWLLVGERPEALPETLLVSVAQNDSFKIVGRKRQRKHRWGWPPNS